MTDFFDFIESLAPEGETLLYVKQTPTGKSDKDGNPIYAWPATRKRPRGESAWYANTASFINERIKDKVSAAAANATHCLFLVLDDVGTKSKTPSIKPTWVLETSPGNFQWGYIFSEQPTTGQFTVAIKAIADAGYTDPGATNPVRNVRVPGSVNLKPGRGNFAAVLHEFSPSVEYTLDDICAALGVIPGEADTATHKRIGLDDDGTDVVLEWVASRGDLIQGVNPSGWAGVVCPNAAEHSDGNPMGRYSPLTRSYCCLHAHCEDWDSRKYLEWVKAEGGPDCAPGLRDTLLADAMRPVMAVLRPTQAYPDETAVRVGDVERKQLARLEKSEWWTRFAYLQNDDMFFDLQDRRQISRGAFNALFRHIDCKTIHGDKKRRVEAAVSFDESRQSKGALSLVGVTYAAGDGVVVTRDGLSYGNTWKDARIVSRFGDVTPWLTLMESLLPETFEREHLLNMMAHKVQHPEVKINHAVLLGGSVHGSGKDTVIAPFIRAVCGPSERNKSLVSAKSFESQFSYHAEAEIMVINELRPDDFKDRRALENTLKPIIAAPPDFITVNRKGLHPYEALNRVMVLAFSNFRDAIALPPDDRRWFVLWTYAPIMRPDDGRAMWEWYRAGGFEAISHYLQTRDVTAWNPFAPPPMTEAKAIMSQQSMSVGESFILSQIEGRVGEFALGVVAAPLQGVLDRLSSRSPAGSKLTMSALVHALAEAKWVDLGRVHSRKHNTKKQMFAAFEMVQQHGKSDLRDLVEDCAGVGAASTVTAIARVK